MIFPYLSKVIILTTVLHAILALDVCRDINTNCQSCDTSKYPLDDENRQNCMKTCDVCTVTNVAFNKSTSQSSVYTEYTGDTRSVPSHAVDGNVDQVWGGTTLSCTHTRIGSPSWWCVDLQQIYNIGSIKLFNRDIHGERLSGFELKISSDGQCDESGFNSSTSCYKDTTPTTQSIYTIENCDEQQQSVSARTVFVIVNNGVVTLCEVQIFSAQCNDGYYSTSSSTSTCQPCNTCLNDKCNPTTGVCTDGCKDGYYGETCTSPCSNTCTNSRCFNTSSSQLQCTGDCVQGYKGSYCQTPCPANCRSCQQDGPLCIECNQGWYGTICQQQCSDGCVGDCIKLDGRCNDCKPDTVGPYCNLTCGKECQPRSDQTTTTCDKNGICTNCIVGRYGNKCDMNCSTGCDGGCDRNDGRCTACIMGKYGDGCDKNCSTGCDGRCDQSTGRCTNCITGRYGDTCDMNCSTGCDGGCDRNGRCTPCIKGKTGYKCDITCNADCTVCNQDNANSCTECKDGRWGSSCNTLCNTNCKPVADTTVGKCDQMTGDCIYGCVPGKIGSNCSTDCEAGNYGDNCDSKCGNCAQDKSCDIVSGTCGLEGCADGFRGSRCQEKIMEAASISPIAIGIIGVLCGIVGTLAVVVSYYFYNKRRQSSQQKAGNDPDYVYSNTDLNPTTSTTNDTLTTGYQNIPNNTRNVDYVNQSFNTEDNSRNMYDTLDHTQDSTQHTYTTIDSNKVN